MDRTLSALYDHRDDALSAVDDLVAAGISRDEISLVSGSEPGETASAGSTYGTEREQPGFWQSLANLFSTEEDRRLHEEGISRGGATLIANVDEAHVDRAVEIMESHHAVDLDERARAWQTQGGDGPYAPGAPSIGMGPETGAVPTTSGAYAPSPQSTSPIPQTGAATSDSPLMPGQPGEAARETRSTAVPTSGAGISGEEAVIPVMEEELHVGKRDVGGGRVRVHTHVVEEPISEEVRLRDESVSIERTPVDRPVRAGDEVFQERIVEAEERHEEPVVSKEARVTEEVRMRKETGEHVERVKDTVRHTEVDVEDERTKTERGRS